MLRKFKPTTPARRWGSVSDFEEITKDSPEKSLTFTLRKTGGRNNQGHHTVRRKGGGHKRRLRIIDFKRNRDDVSAKVLAVEYDPNRSCRIALIRYTDGEKSYIISPLGLKVGDEVVSAVNAEIKTGNRLCLRNIPPGTEIHNLELIRGKGGQIARGAGTAAQIMAKEDKFAHVRLPSGEVRLIFLDCRATIGQVGNADHGAVSIGKAGRNRWRGRKPRSRGVVMNPVDHPMGGGEGKASGGRHPCTPWGKATKGLKTRKSKLSDRYIVKRRK